MHGQAHRDLPALDWETLILDAQTDPGGIEGAACQSLYFEIYSWIEVLAVRWLRASYRSEAEDSALVAIGTLAVLEKVGQFEIRDSDQASLGRMFKAWVATVCKNEWKNNAKKSLEIGTTPEDLEGLDQRSAPSIEDALIAEEDSSDPPQRNREDQAACRSILDEELNRLNEPMRNAILETEDLKDLSRPGVRGRQGEAAEIAHRYGLKPATVRANRKRLKDRAKARFSKEVAK
jgi:DNA-directed RNA polymerase specialized sigma24 family protein